MSYVSDSLRSVCSACVTTLEMKSRGKEQRVTLKHSVDLHCASLTQPLWVGRQSHRNVAYLEHAP